ncbi:hypothetical protein [Kitasatospora sp. LaBMicrA B282]
MSAPAPAWTADAERLAALLEATAPAHQHLRAPTTNRCASRRCWPT